MFKFWKKSGQNKKAQPATSRLAEDGTQLTVIASVQTDVGCHREINEDCSTYVEPDGELL